MRAKEIIKILLKNGWTLKAVSGSHRRYVKEGFPPVTVPFHGSKDLKIGTVKSIERSTGLKLL
ncbi:MAG: addiction module toxin, HicA family [Candidatus Riflebacteria bacterium]|nr:addiction module toxin, HicA family [Candidatus Riflebacteria bacterium]